MSNSGGSAGGSAVAGAHANGGARDTGGTTGSGGSSGETSGGTAGKGVNGGGASGKGSAGNGGAASGGVLTAGGGGASGGTSATCSGSPTTYDAVVLCDHPVGFWAMNTPTAREPDLSGNGNPGTYKGGAPALAPMPNGDSAADFNGSSQSLSVPSKASLSIPTTGTLTWEAWIRPAVVEFPNHSGGYVDWMGKCAEYSPTCEWEARMYNASNSQDRCNRLSAYAFNPTAGLGSGAYFQATCGVIAAGRWYHVVGEYTTHDAPPGCANTSNYPGAISIWVNGVQWNQARHGQTGCMSQYSVVPEANDSPLNIGTMSADSWFQGAVGKVAIYDYLLSQTQITAHYRAMTGTAPTGSCQDTCTL